MENKREEKAVFVGIIRQNDDERKIYEYLDELQFLAETAGATGDKKFVQRVDRPDKATYIRTGKLKEIADYCEENHIDYVIFDDELTPSQQSNLERAFKEPTKVIDRTALILDIFGEHARTREGRLQVQLAQLQYVLPRLRGMWSHLVGEQTRGGIGSRFGQGESQLEVDRRLIRNRIATLREELKRLERRRNVQSKARWESGIYRVALVGYTNAGKSTLLNRLTGADVYVRDELFATLDPTTRSLDLEEGRRITITDTVGFIQKLPTTLVESFKSTLAEALAADLILKVVDASDPHAAKELDAVDAVLSEIGASDIRSVVVYNKCDLLDGDTRRALALEHPEAVQMSALEGTGADALLYRIAQEASDGDVTITVVVPYEKGMLIKMLHERCQVIREEYVQGGLKATVRASQRMHDFLEPYRIEDGPDDGRIAPTS